MKLHLPKLGSAVGPSSPLFGFSVHSVLPRCCIFNHNVKYFFASTIVYQLFGKNYLPVKNRSLSSLPDAHLQNLIGEKRSTKYALCTALSSCAKTLNWCLGVQIHGLIIHNGYEDNLILNSTLVDFYSKCALIEDARNVFDSMKQHDQISWSSIISGYGRSGFITEAISLFKKMLATNFTPNSFTYVSVINSCAVVKTKPEQGALFHAHVIKLGFDTNSFIASTLIDCYSKCGEIGIAASILHSTGNCDDVLYNSMISGYAQNLHYDEALELFSRMRNSDWKPTDYTMSIILNACGCQTILWLGKQVHCSVIKVGFLRSSFVSCALIDMYSKCGSIGEARVIFDQTAEKNIVLWTSIVLGYAQHGMALEGLKLFDNSMMEKASVADHVCFTALLTACNHAGLLDEGIHYFKKMRDCGLAPNLDQYACLIDLFARKGHIEKAMQLMQEMPFDTNNVMLSSFLSSCKSYGALKPGIEASDQLIGLQPNDASTYVTVAQIYAEAGLWDKAAYFKKLMEEKGSKKRDGRSWIEVNRN